jgi:hypothetical protein
MIVRVDCEPDQHGEPRPLRLHLDGRAVDLLKILDVWPGGDHTYVKAEDPKGTTWILRHERLHDVWEVTMFEPRHGASREP